MNSAKMKIKKRYFKKISKINILLWINTSVAGFMAYVAYETFYKTQIEPDLHRAEIYYTVGNNEFFQLFFNADHLRIYKQLELTNTGKAIGFFYRPEIWIIKKDNIARFWYFSECFHGKNSLMLLRSYNIQVNGIFGEEVRYETRSTVGIKKEFRDICSVIDSNDYFMYDTGNHGKLNSKYRRSDTRKHSELDQIITERNFHPLSKKNSERIQKYFDEYISLRLDTGDYYLVELAFRVDDDPIRRIFSFNLDEGDVDVFYSDNSFFKQGFGFNAQINGSPLLRIQLDSFYSLYDEDQVDDFLSRHSDYY